ncbi:uncharacterized protein [Antedon mediterranea]|uniref:uncharacterized protein n=1 Tax=Antedon mediterranea TaxID=105859 RepID=UPI003AF4B977
MYNMASKETVNASKILPSLSALEDKGTNGKTSSNSSTDSQMNGSLSTEQEQLLNQVSPEPAARRNSPKGKNNVQNRRNSGCKLSKVTDVQNGDAKLSNPTASPGRRCISDSKLHVKKIKPHAVSDNLKRKINFVEDVEPKNVVPIKRRKADDNPAAHHKKCPTKYDINHNCQSSLQVTEKSAEKNHSPELLEYKSCHPIGNRVSVGRITTYSEVILGDPRRTFTHNSFMMHEPSKKNSASYNRKQNGVVQNGKEVCVKNNMDGDNKKSIDKQDKVTDIGNDTQDDISDLFEPVDNEILFNKSSTSLEMVMDETNLNSNKLDDIKCDKSDLHKDSNKQNQCNLSVCEENVDLSKTVKKRQLSQKYADIEPRKRKRRIASLTAETKVYLLYEKDEPLKKSPGIRGRKGSKSDATTTHDVENGIATSPVTNKQMILSAKSALSTNVGLSTADGRAKKSASLNGPITKNRTSQQNNGNTLNNCVVKKIYNGIATSSIPMKGRPGRKPTQNAAKIARRRSTNGWKGVGQPRERLISYQVDQPPVKKMCFHSIKRKHDVISESDCILLRSGIRREPPFVGKVSALWEDSENGEIMINLLWYYRPEHTETGRRPQHLENELFACKHLDTNSVACVEDKCYVLTLGEYCRYKCQLKMRQEGVKKAHVCVPELVGGYYRSHRLPPVDADPSCVFLCRQVYDFRQKRVLKNPQ